MKLSLLEPSETITFRTVVHNNAFKIIFVWKLKH